jgi:hypothetical protein
MGEAVSPRFMYKCTMLSNKGALSLKFILYQILKENMGPRSPQVVNIGQMFCTHAITKA